MQNEPDALDDFDVHAVTYGTVTHFKFKWTVADISLLSLPITSPLFKIPFLSECSLKLNWDSSNKIVLELLLKTATENENWSIFLYDKKGQELTTTKSYVLPKNLTLVTERAIPVSSLPSEVLVIVCDFSTMRVKSDICTFQLPLDCRDKLVSDLKALYDHPRHTDVVLKVEGEEVKAHKSILCARSPVFKKMFQSPMNEKEDSVVTIDDVMLYPMKQFLEFLYTGSVELGEDVYGIYAVYYAADKYEVMDLRSLCAEAMRSKLNVENAISQVLWADRHRDEVLKASVMDFVSWNFRKVVDSEDWSSFVANQGKAAAYLVKYCLDK